MTSQIFTMMGLGNMDLAIPFFVLVALVLILLILVIVLFVKHSKLNKKYQKFMMGKNAETLETEFMGMFEDVRFLKAASEKNKKDIYHLYKLHESTIQKVAIKKYDAFQQMGGQLSFCIAWLDENNNGILMNSVHSTDGCYSYVKEIKGGESVLPLGEEEVETLQMAIGSEE